MRDFSRKYLEYTFTRYNYSTNTDERNCKNQQESINVINTHCLEDPETMETNPSAFSPASKGEATIV